MLPSRNFSDKTQTLTFAMPTTLRCNKINYSHAIRGRHKVAQKNPTLFGATFVVQKLLLLLIMVVVVVQKELNCLRISSIRIPSAAWNGSAVVLECNYELTNGDQLYSVKWYRNYVEFYRFQPQTSDQTTATSARDDDNDTSGAAQALKNEFECDGINLDLSKSNGTHVHLRQIQVASEATYKCEVSADAPTFATVSAERQLKVYVLPKQKLTIRDNNHVHVAMQPKVTQQSSDTSSNQSLRWPVYQLNEVLNFTCHSGASRPAARLTWLLNGLPLDHVIMASNDDDDASLATSVVRNTWRSVLVNANITGDLYESRSALALRLQASDLRHYFKSTSRSRLATTSGDSIVGVTSSSSSSSVWPLKLSCVSLLSASFASESSILVSAGDGAVRFKQDGAGARNKPTRRQVSAVTPLGDLPQAASHSEPHTSGNSAQHQAKDKEMVFAEQLKFRWPPPAVARQQQQQQHLRRYKSGNNNNNHQQVALGAVWTSRQLREQAEFIEQNMVSLSPGANELAEMPRIEAKPVGVAQAANNQQAAIYNEAGADLGVVMMSTEEVKQTATTQQNEVVNFTCISSIDQAKQQRVSQHTPVQLHWFINGKQVFGERINSFDGNHFKYVNSNDDDSDNAHNSAPRRTCQAHECMLLIEFGPTLVELKEFSLKCKQVVEQPLIEFESSQVLYFASSPFIQAMHQEQHPSYHHHRPTGSSAYNLRPINSGGGSRSRTREKITSTSGNDDDDLDEEEISSQKNNRPNVIRMRAHHQSQHKFTSASQFSRSNSSVSLKPYITSLLVASCLLMFLLFNPRRRVFVCCV